MRSCFGLTAPLLTSQLAIAGAVGAAVAEVEPDAHTEAVNSTKEVVDALVEVEEVVFAAELALEIVPVVRADEVLMVAGIELVENEVTLLVDFEEDGGAIEDEDEDEDEELFELVLSVEELEVVVDLELELELVDFELVLDDFGLGVPIMTVPL